MAFDQIKYVNQFNRDNYDVIRALVPKGRGKEIKAFAKSQGKSVSQLMIDALEIAYGLDLSKLNGE